VFGFGDGRGEMSREDVASAKRAKSVGEVNSSTASLSRRKVGGSWTGGYVECMVPAGRDNLAQFCGLLENCA
jgi:hypothetical protein